MKKVVLGGVISFILAPMLFLILIVAGADVSAPSWGGGDATSEELQSLLNENLIVPVMKGQYIFTERFGQYTSLDGNHYGVDLAGEIGTVLFSISNGEVVESFDGCDNTPPGLYEQWAKYCSSDRGNHLIIRSVLGSMEIYVTYYHMNKGSVLPQVGDQVLQGQSIGNMGNSGFTTGAHLHLEFQTLYQSYPSSFENRLDPEPFLPLQPFQQVVEEVEGEYHYIDPNAEDPYVEYPTDTTSVHRVHLSTRVLQLVHYVHNNTTEKKGGDNL